MSDHSLHYSPILTTKFLYGRRGTGKTHALSYLANYVESQGDIAIQVDMRTVGSSGGIYSDSTIPLSERATRLLVDTYSYLHDSILNLILEGEQDFNLSILGPTLDRLAESITQVVVLGTVQNEQLLGEKSNTQEGVKLSIGDKSKLSFELNDTELYEISHQTKIARSGIEQHRVHFGTVRKCFAELLAQLSPRKVWVLLDEWSEVPLDLQPFLADLLRRTLFNVTGISVKIAAIEQRSEFRIQDNTNYIGIELGADASTSLNLDEYMVFDNNSEQAKAFFLQLIYKHVSSILGAAAPNTPQDFMRAAFTQNNAFEEFVRSAEGVPRDAINVLALAAQRAHSDAISVPDIRAAAKTWYNRAKEQAITSKPKALDLLRWIIDEVIAHRKARAFLLRSDSRNELIEFLFDARILHLVKQSVSSHDLPGIRFNVYSIDYGCYVDLINTTRAPQGLFEIETDEGARFVEVPANDYRAIRRAILNLEKFEDRLL